MPTQQRVELLAPAGGPEAGLSAFAHGADAIYLGLKRFSARADADNFAPDELEGIVGYAHALTPRRRVFAAVNTLVLDDELAEVARLLGALEDVGVDAVIVQDLGVARLARRHFGRLRLHASTQLAVHGRAGVEALRALGFARATLARELTLEEIRDAAAAPGIEVEAFVHGALCYAYSGLCLFSSQLVGRSGNRGACAYPCRDRWEVSPSPGPAAAGPSAAPPAGYAFSMKDLAAPDFVQALREAGVASLKIEGRKKSPLYVATTVSYYRALLDGGLGASERASREQDIQAVFSRPWTSLFLGSRLDKDVADRDVVGHRGARIGAVESVVRRGGEYFLRFHSERALSRHDGLQVDLPGQGRPFGFPVDALYLAAADRRAPPREVVEAPAGRLVEVGLPRGHPPIPEGAPIACASSQAVKLRYRHAPQNLAAHRARVDLSVRARLSVGELRVEARAGQGDRAVRACASLPGPFGAARDPSRTEGALRAAFERLGDSPLKLVDFALEDPGGLFVPVSRANELRRQLALELAEKLAAASSARLSLAQAELEPRASTDAPGGAPRWSILVDRLDHLAELSPEDLAEVEEVVVGVARDPLEAMQAGLSGLAAKVGAERVRLALPTIARAWEEKGLQRRVDRLIEAGFRRWQGANVAAWRTLRLAERAPGALDLAADWPLYVLNREAARQLWELGVSRVTLSVEDGLANMARLLAELGDRASVVVFQDTPLFVSESCPFANLSGGCPGSADCSFETLPLRSSHGSEVLAINEACRSVVINAEPFSLAGRLEALNGAGARHLRADFVHRPYAPHEVRAIWRALRSGLGGKSGHVANFDRGLRQGPPI